VRIPRGCCSCRNRTLSTCGRHPPRTRSAMMSTYGGWRHEIQYQLKGGRRRLQWRRLKSSNSSPKTRPIMKADTTTTPPRTRTRIYLTVTTRTIANLQNIPREVYLLVVPPCVNHAIPQITLTPSREIVLKGEYLVDRMLCISTQYQQQLHLIT
jgi:hypothetical protein